MDKGLKVPCCKNCKHCWLDRCKKLRALPEFAQLCYDDVKGVGDYLDNDLKRLRIKESHCCEDFENRWLEYPIAVKEAITENIEYNTYRVGALVRIKPCGSEYKNKTYLGFYLGNLPYSISQSFNPETHILTLGTVDNPAIFVPELKKIIFGFESWWGEVESEEDLEDITDETIANQWYVKLLNSSKEENDGER